MATVAEKKEEATKTLAHYVTMLMETQGLHVDSDTYAELRYVVDCIVDAAVIESQVRSDMKRR